MSLAEGVNEVNEPVSTVVSGTLLELDLSAAAGYRGHKYFMVHANLRIDPWL